MERDNFYERELRKPFSQLLAEVERSMPKSLEDELNVRVANASELPVVVEKAKKVADPDNISNIEVVNSLSRDIFNFIVGSLKLTYALPTFARQSLEKNGKESNYSFCDVKPGPFAYLGSTLYSFGLNAVLYHSFVDNRHWAGYLLPLGTWAISGAAEVFRARKLKLKENKKSGYKRDYVIDIIQKNQKHGKK